MRISDWSSDVCSSDLIHRAIVDFAAATVVTVIGIGKLAVLEIRREIVGLQHVAGAVLQSGASLHAIGAWHPAKKMIERAVLHHHHDDVIKARLFRIRQAVRAGRDAATAAAAWQRQTARRGRGGADELPSADAAPLAMFVHLSPLFDTGLDRAHV